MIPLQSSWSIQLLFIAPIYHLDEGLCCRHSKVDLNLSMLCVHITSKKRLKIPKEYHQPYIEERHTMHWPNEMEQKNKQWSSTKRYTEKKKWSTGTQLKTGGELRCFRMVNRSCTTIDTRRVTAKRHVHLLIWKSCWTPSFVNKYK
jgi:hypothetical protein